MRRFNVNYIQGPIGAAGRGASVVFLTAALAAVPASAQTVSQIVVLHAPAGRAPASGSASLREIDDPHSGARWFLFRDPDHPEGPGRWVLEDNGQAGGNARAAGSEAGETEPEAIVHAGDRLIVEEHTAAFDAWWEADSLGRGPIGSAIAVLLKIGGRIVRARILSAGHAVLAIAEARP